MFNLACCGARYAPGARCSLHLGKLILALLAATVHGSQETGLVSVTDLTGSGAAAPWSLSNANASVAVTGVSLPAYVLDVLQSRKLIPNPLVRFNERELEWVRDDTWTFAREFTLDKPWTGGELVLAGVDTVADVSLNGRPLGRIANEFRAHRLAVAPGDLVTADKGANKLTITIRPAKLEAERLSKAYPYTVPSIAHVATFAEHKPFIRKAGADFGWDWGPALGPAGIFGSIYLLAAADTAGKAAGSPAGSYLSAALVRQRFEGDTIHLVTHLQVSRPAGAAAAGASDAAAVEGTARVRIPELGIDVARDFKGDAASKACGPATSGPAGGVECNFFLELEVPRHKVELWWPAGHGAQKLYPATVAWNPAGGPAACDEAPIYNTDDPAAAAPAAPATRAFGCSLARRNIGFRTVELVTVPPAEAAKELAPGLPAPTGADAEGESMYFRVNGIAMFLKGANLIPFDTVRTRATSAYMHATLQGALDVHMNALRVWGGGIYLPDEFYDMADRMGILLWQEAMFACAMYPADPAFLADVRQEIKEQVLRLGSHASLGVWGGNNENEIAFHWFEESRRDRPFYQAEYVKLYFDTVGDEITKLDPERAFVDSSPANGPFYTGATADGKLSAPLKDLLKVKRWGDAQSAKYGDVHYYNNEDDCTAPGVVPEVRMMSEFGWQSDAPWFAIRAVTPPEDWDTWAPGAQYRQRWNKDGTRIKTEQMKKVFGGLPAHNFKSASTPERARLYADWIYLRQVHQSVCYDHAISMMRRKMRDPRRGSMGSLYWQLNDVWQGASWSSIDYELRYKPVHYVLKRAYAPVQVVAYTPEDDANRVAVDVALDEAGALPAPVHIKVWLQPLGGGGGPSCPKGSVVESLTVPAGARGGVPVWSASIDEVLAKKPGCARDTCYLRIEAREAGPEGGKAARGKAHLAAATPAAARRGGAQLLGVPAGEAQESYHYFSKFNALRLPQVAVRAGHFKQLSPREVEFTLTANGGAAVYAFWDAAPAGHFSRNALNLRPCEPLKVTFTAAAKDVSAAELEDSLAVWTLNGALQRKQLGGWPVSDGGEPVAKRGQASRKALERAF